jgi:uncharacterized protein YcbK (DUF882 family)
MKEDHRLSANFNLSEFVKTNHKEFREINAEEGKRPDNHRRLKMLCEFILQPIRNKVGVMIISSGYRCKALNEAVKGSKNSDHLKACAADFKLPEGVSLDEAFKWIQNNSIGNGGKLPVKQCILENGKNSRWIHISILEPEFLIGTHGDKGMKYEPA